MGKIKEYVLVSTFELQEFNKQIQEWINKGGSPHGATSITETSKGVLYSQPMVVYK